jgi:hypothetical protein
MTETDIDVLRDRVEKLTKLLAGAKAMLKAAEIAQCDIKIGDLVHFSGVQFRVCDIQPQLSGKPWVVGNPRRQDGTFGTGRRLLYSSWEKSAFGQPV